MRCYWWAFLAGLVLEVIVFSGWAVLLLAGSDPFGAMMSGQSIWHAASDIGVLLLCLYVVARAVMAFAGSSIFFAYAENAIVLMAVAGLMYIQSWYVNYTLLDQTATLAAAWGAVSALAAAVILSLLRRRGGVSLHWGGLLLRAMAGVLLVTWGFMAALNLGYCIKLGLGTLHFLPIELLGWVQLAYSVIAFSLGFVSNFRVGAIPRLAAMSGIGLPVALVAVSLMVFSIGWENGPITLEFAALAVFTFAVFWPYGRPRKKVNLGARI